MQLARILWARGAHERALEAVERALAISPDVSESLELRADILLEMKRWALAERSYRDALRLDPDSALALNHLGVALERQGRMKEAAVAFHSAVLADPTLRVAKTNTVAATESLLKVGAVGVGFVVVVGKLVLVGGRGAASSDSSVGLLLFAVFCVFAVVAWALHKKAVRKREADLEVDDPELMAIYRKLKADDRL